MTKSNWDALEREPGLLRQAYRFGLIEDLARPMVRDTADPDDDQAIWHEAVFSMRPIRRGAFRKRKSARER